MRCFYKDGIFKVTERTKLSKSVYGKTKLAGEKLLKNIFKKNIILKWDF